MCPDCGSLDIVGDFHFATMDAQTGYDDSGPTFRCRDCGARGPAEDADCAPARIAPGRELAAVRIDLQQTA